MSSAIFYVMVTVALQINLCLVFEGMENSPNKDLIKSTLIILTEINVFFDVTVTWAWSKQVILTASKVIICLHVCASLLINSVLEEVVYAVRSNLCCPHKSTFHIMKQGLFLLHIMSSHPQCAEKSDFLSDLKKKISALSGEKVKSRSLESSLVVSLVEGFSIEHINNAFLCQKGLQT